MNNVYNGSWKNFRCIARSYVSAALVGLRGWYRGVAPKNALMLSTYLKISVLRQNMPHRYT